MRSRHISTVINRPMAEVYDYASTAANLPLWAAGLATVEVTVDGDTLLVDSPMGTVRVRFAPRNDFGILDHEVTLPDGSIVYNPFRVLPHPQGAEVVMTVRQLSDDDDEFERDVAAVAADLERLRALLERSLPPEEPAPARPALQAEVRVARPADAESLGRLLYEFNTEFGAPTPSIAQAAARFRRLLGREDVLVVVARLPRAPGSGPGSDPDISVDVGFAFLTLRPTPLWDGPLAQLEELYVRGDLRSGGIGTAVLDLALFEARQRDCEEILINVDSDDAGARRFYERNGFSDIDPDSGSGSVMLCYLRQL